VLKAAEEQKAERVLEINVEMGQVLSIPPSQFKFAFKVCSQGTKAEGAAVHVRTVPVTIHCQKCGFEGEVKVRTEHSHDTPLYLECPRCGSTEAERSGGDLCTIKSVKLSLKPGKAKR